MAIPIATSATARTAWLYHDLLLQHCTLPNVQLFDSFAVLSYRLICVHFHGFSLSGNRVFDARLYTTMLSIGILV